MSTGPRGSHPFDVQARELHRTAVDQVSTPTLARLRQSRQNLPHDNLRAQRWRWGAAVAGSALLAVAIGVQLRHSPTPNAAPLSAAATSGAAAPDYPTSLAALDESPDLYLWLAAESDPLLLEQL